MAAPARARLARSSATPAPSLTDKALCTAWQRRIDEANFRMKYAAKADKAEREADYERQIAAFIDSACR